MGKAKTAAAKQLQKPRADGLRRVLLVRNNKARLAWVNKDNEAVA
jgi:hypothetical protein